MESDPKQRARFLRARAEEVRASAAATQDATSRISMLQIADTYERVARQLDPR
jgi:hypothetical protein